MDTPMIMLEHIVKSFSGRDAAVHAASDVSLSLERGSIYGFVGFSGAGKSTLVRCINMLERPTSGRVFGRQEWTCFLFCHAPAAKDEVLFSDGEHPRGCSLFL